MAGQVQAGESWSRSPWRVVIWGTAGLLLLVPLVAMQFSSGWNWSPFDFVAMGALLAGVCGTFELAARATVSKQYRAAVAIAVVASFLLIWMNAAAGIIGDEDNPANLLFGGVLLVAFLGSLGARFRATSMAPVFVATALAQAAVGVIGVVSFREEPMKLLALTGFFVGLWLVSAQLFRWAGKARVSTGRHPMA
ncbi:MAG TPA: hypothetical protein VF720_10695 [Candidatus Eisenbacteria bacterium]